MSDDEPTDIEGRLGSVEAHVAWVEKSVDDLDGITRELFERVERLEQVAKRLDAKLALIIEALSEGRGT